MSRQKVYIYFLVVVFSLFAACEKFTEQEKFNRPDWLPGKLYTTVLAQENLSMFAECLQLSGLDSILDVSGSWTVFAPTNEAMQQFLLENNYTTVSSIPLNELEKIAEFHVIQNPWSFEQLQNLSAFGWRTKDDGNVNSYAFKRETILKNPIEKYWIQNEDKNEMIVTDSLSTRKFKKVFVESRKYAPVFYDKFMTVSGTTSVDYRFYFDRDYEPGNVFFAGTKIIESDIFAENGFVHIVDHVATPMLNAEEMLERIIPGESYQLFLQLVYWYFPSFEANLTATFNQAAVSYGGNVDTLWDLHYSNLAFDIHKEQIGYQGGNINETLVRHNGMFAPTDNAFRFFVDDILTQKSGFPHWRDYQSLPNDIVNIILSKHFQSTPIYPSKNQYQNIFKAVGNNKIDESDIIRKEFGSNCTFIGLDKYIPDKVFTSVTGPVFLRPSFSIFRLALQYARIDDNIAYSNSNLSFFPIPDYVLRADSSLLINWINEENNQYNFQEYNRSKRMLETLSRNTIVNRIYNHVGLSVPNGSANKEFIRTINGNYIIFNNSQKTVQGNVPSTIGYKGEETRTCYATPLEEPADNGKTYSTSAWFNFENVGMQTTLMNYPKFYNLLNKAGYTNNGSFIYGYENYTIFIPSDQALDNYQADKLSVVELRKFLKHHFLKGAMIFTDNKQDSGDYLTENGDYLKVKTGPDIIEILDESGNIYLTLNENENTTNVMITEHSSVSSIVHVIDKVLIP